jgi:hypothetical protein
MLNQDYELSREDIQLLSSRGKGSFRKVPGSLHIPFTVFRAASFIIEAQNEDIIPLGLERGPILLKVETPTIGHGTIPLNQDGFVMTVIGTGCVGVL